MLPPGPCEANAAPEHDIPVMIIAVVVAARDAAWCLRDVAIDDLLKEEATEDTTIVYGGFA